MEPGIKDFDFMFSFIHEELLINAAGKHIIQYTLAILNTVS